ncbi:hypothetical protein OROHE_015331 [Orobanche hederae]
MPSQEILKIRDGTPLEWPSQDILKIHDEILKIRDEILKIHDVARILFFKIRPSQEILKIRDGTPLEAEEILTYIKNPRNGSVWHFYSKLYVPSNVLQKKRVARILFFKIRPSQEILKIHDGTPLEAEEILTYIKGPRNRPSKYIEILKIHDGTPLEWPSQEILKIHDDILKIRDGTPLEAKEILTYINNPRNGSVWHFYSKLYVPSNVLQKKRVARILFFKIRPSQEILKIHDGTPLEAEEILTYIKGPRNRPSKYIEPSQDILKIHDEPSQEILKIHDDILKIRDGTPLEAKEILTYINNPRNGSVWHFYSKLYVPSNVLQKKRVARILFFKIRPSQEILKIHDGTPLEAEEILTYIKGPRNRPSKYIEILKIRDGTPLEKRVARILFFKISPSQEILKIHDGTPLEAEEKILKIRDGTPLEWPSQEILKIHDVARILFFKIRPSQEILKIRDGTPLEAEEILTYIKNPRNGSVWHFYSKLYVPSNVLQKKRVARILFFKIRPSQEILKIHDGTPLEAEEILTYIKGPRNRVAQILFFKIRLSQEILKIRDGTPLEAEEILTYIKKNPRNGLVWHFSSKLDVPSNIVQKKRVARILFFKISPSQEILKIHDGTPLEAEEILTYIKKPSKRIEPSQDILKIRDGTPLEAKEILTYINNPRNGSVWHFYSKLYVPSNVLQKKRVARILFFKIRPSQEILKIHDGTPLEAEEILTYIKGPRNSNPSQEILKIHDDILKIHDEILKIRDDWPSQEILKIHDGTPLEKF